MRQLLFLDMGKIMLLRLLGVVMVSSLLLACGGGGGGGSNNSGVNSTTGSSSSTGTTAGSTTTGTGATGSNGTTSGPVCTANFMGSSKLMVGAQMADATASGAPFDARYLYLAGSVRPAGACVNACSSACGGWWGCWQEFETSPGVPAPMGLYATRHIQNATAATWQGTANPQVPVFTYYELLNSAGAGEGAGEVAAINNAALMTRYLDDWRFLLQKIGNSRAMLHIEPDFWGFVRGVNSNPHQVPAAVKSANATDCAAQENSAAGLARCMIAMVRKYAPNATVGLHASPWNYTVSGDGAATGAYMLALGAADGDFVVTDPSDRDAGYYTSIGQNRWWTDTTAATYLAWSKTVADTVGKPTVMWQIPLGNMTQNNTNNHWQDNRVDYLFAHLADVAKSGIVALLFGAGGSQQTSPETDGGNLISKTTANWQAGGTSLCP